MALLTNYGALPIEVDLTTGRARMVRAGVPRRIRVAEPPEPAEAPARRSVYDSALEAARARYLGLLSLDGEVRQVCHHLFHVELAPGTVYTPDFLVWRGDGSITIEEVKGSLKMQNARDSVTRLKVAAGLLPMFRWVLVTRVGRLWKERVIPSERGT